MVVWEDFKIIHTVKEWQARPLEALYPIVWLDAINYKIRENGKVVSKAVYTILGVNLEGRKEVLGLYLSEHEGANFWLQDPPVQYDFQFIQSPEPFGSL